MDERNNWEHTSKIGETGQREFVRLLLARRDEARGDGIFTLGEDEYRIERAAGEEPRGWKISTRRSQDTEPAELVKSVVARGGDGAIQISPKGEMYSDWDLAVDVTRMDSRAFAHCMAVALGVDRFTVEVKKEPTASKTGNRFVEGRYKQTDGTVVKSGVRVSTANWYATGDGEGGWIVKSLEVVIKAAIEKAEKRQKDGQSPLVWGGRDKRAGGVVVPSTTLERRGNVPTGGETRIQRPPETRVRNRKPKQ